MRDVPHSQHANHFGSGKALLRKAVTRARSLKGFNLIYQAGPIYEAGPKKIYLGGQPVHITLTNDELSDLEKIMKEEQGLSKGFVDLRTPDEWEKWPRDSRFDPFNSDEKTFKFPVSDESSFHQRFPTVDEALDFIDQKDIVYINCRAGVGRSYSLLLAWLMSRLCITANAAHLLIEGERPQVDPNPIQILKVCEYVFQVEKKKYLDTNVNIKRVMDTFYDFCGAFFKRYKFVLRKGGYTNLGKINPHEMRFLLDDLKTLAEEAQFLLPQLSSENGFEPKDAEKFHNNLSAIFRMITGGLSIADSESLQYEKTPLSNLIQSLQIARKRNVFLEKGEARAHCTALINETNSLLEEINPTKEIERIEKKIDELNQKIGRPPAEPQKSENEIQLASQIKKLKAQIEKLQEEFIKNRKALSETDKAMIVHWENTLPLLLEELSTEKESENITLKSVKSLQEKILDIISLGTNIILLSSPDEKVPNLDLISAANPNTPILIKHGEFISLYGMSQTKEWKTTLLEDSAPFKNLTFPPADSGYDNLKNYDSRLNSEMREAIKKAHQPEYAGNCLFEFIRLLRETLRKIFNKTVYISTHFTQKILYTDPNLLSQVSRYTLFQAPTNNAQNYSSSDTNSSASESAAESTDREYHH